MNRQSILLFVTLIMLGCQPSVKSAHLSDPLHQFIQEEIALLEKGLAELDREQALLTEGLPEDLISLQAMKAAAFKANRFRIQKSRRKLIQERTFLQMTAQKRAVQVQKRVLAGEKKDVSRELAEFKARYTSRPTEAY